MIIIHDVTHDLVSTHRNIRPWYQPIEILLFYIAMKRALRDRV
jgi:hypothetical protein